MPNPLVIKLIRWFSKLLQCKLNEVNIPQDAKQISIIELDELFSYCQKTNKIYVWLAVDRDRNKIVDFEVTASRDFKVYWVIPHFIK